MQYPVTLHLVFLQVAQSTSQYASKSNEADAEKNKSIEEVVFRYFIICKVACQCGLRGLYTNWLR